MSLRVEYTLVRRTFRSADMPELVLESPAASAEAASDEVEAELLVEEVSIDGLCGVY